MKKIIELIGLLFCLTLFSGCSSIYKQLPDRESREAYKFIFHGIHRPLTPCEKNEAIILLKQYTIDYQVYDNNDGLNPDLYYQLWNNMIESELKIIYFEDKISFKIN